jgi:hypothetical protein
MSIKVFVSSTPKNRVSINTPQRNTVRTLYTGVSTLSALYDVDASDPDNNEVLVYDSTQDKYVIKTLPIVDGGSY